MSVAIRHDDLRRRNRAMVIAAVRRAEQPSRTEIAAATGLSHSTISAIAADLIAEGVLTETKGGGAASGRRGRPQVALTLAPRAAAAVTVILLLDYLEVALVDYAGRTLAAQTQRLDTRHMPAGALLDACVAQIESVLRQPAARGLRVLRIVCAVQGTTDIEGRTLIWSPITPHSGLALGERLMQAFGVPVTVENDCNMIATALRWRDSERYREDFIAILLSHGIGMGLVLKGELFMGTHSSGAEFGHMIHIPGGALCRCGRHGCVEAYAGDYAIWREAKGLGDGAEPVSGISGRDMDALIAAARRGEGPERAAYRRAGRAIGFALGSLFALIDPAPVAMVGTGAAAFDLVEPSLREALAATAGGTHSGAISFATEPDEMPLIRLGCAMHALTFIDAELFAQAGPPAPSAAGGGGVESDQSSLMA